MVIIAMTTKSSTSVNPLVGAFVALVLRDNFFMLHRRLLLDYDRFIHPHIGINSSRNRYRILSILPCSNMFRVIQMFLPVRIRWRSRMLHEHARTVMS